MCEHPRDDPATPMRGVFGTRSADRPNRSASTTSRCSLAGERVHVGPLEAVHGTPIVDIKPVLGQAVSKEPVEVRTDRPPQPADPAVRLAEVGDAEDIGRLLHDFNSEFDDPTPGPAFIAERARRLISDGEITVLLGGAKPHGIAVLRFRPALFKEGLDSYLEELYVVPDLRGQGLGRALMEATIDLARGMGAGYMDLGTSEDDVAARALYESLGFSNREGKADGPVSLFYEREL